MTNVLSHFKQANGLFPLWILSCSFKVPLSSNDWSHLEQANGFSPVWIFSWRFQSTTICKWLVTFGTGICSLFIVNPFMLFQSASLAECLVTFQTGKWLTTVWSFHDFQITTICKWLVTFGTGKWSLSCSFKVPLQLNVLSHFKQANGFFTVWILSWFSNHNYL